MPVNRLHMWCHRVEDGWDPIPLSYARDYSSLAETECDPCLVDRIEAQIGGFEGKRVLDLGGGPGQYSVLFAKRGARVTWHDVSRVYQKIASERAKDARVDLQFSLGYLDEAGGSCPEPFDLVFCRVCWCYSRSDRRFAKLIYSLLKPGGIGYIACNTPEFSRPTGLRKLQYWLNGNLWWKIGHPMPPHGRIARLFQRYPIEKMEIDYSSNLMDVVLFRKSMSSDVSLAHRGKALHAQPR